MVKLPKGWDVTKRQNNRTTTNDFMITKQETKDLISYLQENIKYLEA